MAFFNVHGRVRLSALAAQDIRSLRKVTAVAPRRPDILRSEAAFAAFEKDKKLLLGPDLWGPPPSSSALSKKDVQVVNR